MILKAPVFLESGWLSIFDSALVQNIVAAAAVALAVAVLTRLALVGRRFFWRRFLGGSTSEPTHVVTGEVRLERGGHRYMAAGDIDALVLTSMVLARGGNSYDATHDFAADLQPDHYRKHMVVIGGPNNNSVCRDALGRLTGQLPVGFERSVLVVGDGEEGIGSFWIPFSGVQCFDTNFQYEREPSDEVVPTVDWGIIVRCRSPYDPSGKSVIWIVAGCGSNGCLAAADVLHRLVFGGLRRRRKIRRILGSGRFGVAVVKASLADGVVRQVQPEMVLAERRLPGGYVYRRLVRFERDSRLRSGFSLRRETEPVTTV